MTHIALYRTWRSQAFRELVGQKPIVQTLQNSLREQRFTHAYLFSGPRGTGKTSAAKILAKAVNCVHGPAEEPCNECEACIRISQGSVMDVVEIDAASNRGVEEIRDIRDKVKYAPTEVRYKVYIIDEVHMLTTEAFNALLKTLEEPPAHVIFILATTEPHKLPATIISRCQRFDFRRVSMEEQVGRLAYVCREENIAIEEEALHYIARLSEGGMRDALSLLDQASSFAVGTIAASDVVAMTGGLASDQFEKLVGSMKEQDIGAALELIDQFMQEGKSADKCMENLIHYFRDLLMIRLVPDSSVLTERVFDVARLDQVASLFGIDQLITIIEVLNQYQSEMKYSVQPQTILEVAVMKACGAIASGGGSRPSEAPPASRSVAEPEPEALSQLTRRIQQLEEQLAKLMQGGVPAAGAQQSRSPVAPRSSNAAVRKASVRLDDFTAAVDSHHTRALLGKWTQILAMVKERKITVHAWLVDGEPVAIHGDTVLVAFKSAMHRDTTEKPANKQLIEQVISEALGETLKLATVMQKEWKEAREGASEPYKEEMTLQAEDSEPDKEPWVDEAIKLFGEDLVSIKDE
ncbi:DNA polymerase III subunit gamma/tau [Paenibacillus chitinolyticus]|uniref:DNA polymerase III subunit gamma/tau n=1 Tax=Paenibacillus chitinolyticus TaxID=79263 RepID=UPI001C455A50|nr:DNA polymerase III subunit gamma/tau [Paenibacillus chitinolyticus]MBV6717364.1 DNA polymerase III subunit gamma/tau [Paenibacillus chitinolyticus]